MKEVKLKCVAGPFNQIPFNNFIQSPIGLVPKAGGDQTRLISHLSYDFKKKNKNGKEEEETEPCMGLLNSNTPKEKCSVKYRDLDFAVNTFLQLAEEIMSQSKTDGDGGADCRNRTDADSEQMGNSREDLKNCWRRRFSNHMKSKLPRKPIFAGKSNLKSAFCILGLSKWSWKWLVMKAQDPLTGEWKFFVDKCLPFGSSINCSHFQRFSDSLRHIIEFRLQVSNRVTNYLDDFLFIAVTLALCNAMIQWFLDLCVELNIPVSLEKTDGVRIHDLPGYTTGWKKSGTVNSFRKAWWGPIIVEGALHETQSNSEGTSAIVWIPELSLQGDSSGKEHSHTRCTPNMPNMLVIQAIKRRN